MFCSRNRWDWLEHNNWSIGNPALSSDFRNSEHLGEQAVGEWLVDKKSQSARERAMAYLVIESRSQVPKRRGACELRNGIAGPGTVVKRGKVETEGID